MKNIEKRRTIDTFPARDLQMPERKGFTNNLDRYAFKDGYGLELYKREYKRIEERKL